MDLEELIHHLEYNHLNLEHEIRKNPKLLEDLVSPHLEYLDAVEWKLRCQALRFFAGARLSRRTVVSRIQKIANDPEESIVARALALKALRSQGLLQSKRREKLRASLTLPHHFAIGELAYENLSAIYFLDTGIDRDPRGSGKKIPHILWRIAYFAPLAGRALVEKATLSSSRRTLFEAMIEVTNSCSDKQCLSDLCLVASGYEDILKSTATKIEELLEHPETCSAACWALSHCQTIPTSIAPSVRSYLDSADKKLAFHALAFLCRVENAGVQQIPNLIRLLTHRNKKVRSASCHQLVRLGVKPKNRQKIFRFLRRSLLKAKSSKAGKSPRIKMKRRCEIYSRVLEGLVQLSEKSAAAVAQFLGRCKKSNSTRLTLFSAVGAQSLRGRPERLEAYVRATCEQNSCEAPKLLFLLSHLVGYLDSQRSASQEICEIIWKGLEAFPGMKLEDGFFETLRRFARAARLQNSKVLRHLFEALSQLGLTRAADCERLKKLTLDLADSSEPHKEMAVHCLRTFRALAKQSPDEEIHIAKLVAPLLSHRETLIREATLRILVSILRGAKHHETREMLIAEFQLAVLMEQDTKLRDQLHEAISQYGSQRNT